MPKDKENIPYYVSDSQRKHIGRKVLFSSRITLLVQLLLILMATAGALYIYITFFANN